MASSSEGGNACSKNLLKKDDTIFREYIENTTTHGVVRVFRNKSIVRRLFWLLIVLGASAGCLYNCINRIRFLASSPTSTTISVDREQPLDFPAVTFCNLNIFTVDGLSRSGVDPLLAAGVLNAEIEDLFEGGICTRYEAEMPDLGNVIFEDLIRNAGHQRSSFIMNCTFMGEFCREDDFVSIPTPLGECYTFNSGSRKEVLQVNKTGIRHGLSVSLNVEQEQYIATPSLDAGVNVLVHPQSEPPLPLERGIAVPPGSNAVIGIMQRNVIDNTGRACCSEDDVSQLSFLQQNNPEYSVSACSLNCFLTQIGDICECSLFPRQYPPDLPLRPCSFLDACCLQLVGISPTLGLNSSACDCPSSCKSVSYNAFASYSVLPALYALKYFRQEFGGNATANVAGVTVYYESPHVETFTTSYSYGPVALLSDIGGQLGLFLGVSVISMMEFGMWLLDEIRDRCFCGVFSRKESVEVANEAEMKEKETGA